jgi:hypothetical protein
MTIHAGRSSAVRWATKNSRCIYSNFSLTDSLDCKLQALVSTGIAVEKLRSGFAFLPLLLMRRGFDVG